MRKILYVSGTRADYGPARRVLQALHADPEVDLSLVVTGMHLDALHGETWREVEADGFPIAEKVYARLAGDTTATMAGSIGLMLYGFAQTFERQRPDLVLVLGDRGEMLAGAVAAATQNIVVAHMTGGSLSGSIDDSIRHAITKFAHVHLAAHPEHVARIRQMGEAPELVYHVGLPGGDLRPDVTLSREEVCRRYGLPEDQPYLIVIQHPVTQTADEASEQVRETLEAVAALPYPALLANPNDDAGGRAILAEMQRYAARYEHLHELEPPGSREVFASLVAHAGVQVSNSSSGIVEAMSVPVPVVNIGDRQRGRERYAKLLNVGYDRQEISEAIETALHDEGYREELRCFESGWVLDDLEARVVGILKDVDLDLARSPKPFIDSETPQHAPAEAAGTPSAEVPRRAVGKN
jgi:UDP-N-acetylglucosamine 2-epimerase (non-hydrolysing)/GDP/UDP-N,N'-diacetylbacillosamine 2-epimerase (hydrolysing)